jgi:V/A-type H+-transporting ATPase subunit E
MGLEVVVKAVLAKGEEEANHIKQEGIEEANVIKTDAEIMARNILAEKREHTAEQIEHKKSMEAASTNLEMKRGLLNVQKEILDETYEDAKRALLALPESERETILKSLLESQTEFQRVYSNKQDEPIVRRIAQLEYGGNINCVGGIMLENDDGTVTRDLTFESILESVRENSLKQVSEILSE